MKMMKTKNLILFLFIAMTASAQKQFTLEDLNFGGNNYHNMVPKNRYTAWWGDELVHTDHDRCTLIDKKTGKESLLFTLETLNSHGCVTANEHKIKSLFRTAVSAC